MKCKIALKILVPILALLIVSGCSQSNSTPNPENTVKDFWAAFKEGDFEKAKGFLSEDNQIGNAGENIFPDDLGTPDDELAKELISSIDINVKSHEIEGDTATVNVVVSWPDMEIFLGKFLAEALSVAFQASFLNASQEEIYLLLKPVFLDALNDTPIVETSHEIQLTLVDNNWIIATHPLPDPEKVFDFSEFGESIGEQFGIGQ